MDYQELLALADRKQNALNDFRSKNGSRSGGATRGPDPAAIAAFKARKEREERERAARAAREREHLLALRAQNSKSAKKAKMMQQRTRENDFSKITVGEHEAKDSEKVEAKIRRAGIKGTKERMKARIQMDEQLAGLTRKDREKVIARMERDEPVKVVAKRTKVADVIAKVKEERAKSGPEIRKQRPTAPTLSYDQLLSMANANSTKKTSLEEHIKAELEEVKKRERPMTAKEKERAREEEYYRNRAKGARLPTAEERVAAKRRPQEVIEEEEEEDVEPYEPEPVIKPRKPEPGPRLNPNFRQPARELTYTPTQQASRLPATATPTRGPSGSSSQQVRTSAAQARNGINQTRPAPPARLPGPRAGPSQGRAPPRPPLPPRSDRERMPPPSHHRSPPLSAPPRSRIDVPPRQPPPQAAGRQPPPGRSPAALPPRPRPRAFSPPPPPPRPRTNLPPIGATYRRGMYNDYEPEQPEEDDDYYDEEEDDEMADFIDDDPEYDAYAPEEDYTRTIRQIFGYDKRKYRIDDDDDIEEASFAQCMKEEKASLRAGIQEDLEDIRREEEELRAKAARKKAKRK